MPDEQEPRSVLKSNRMPFRFEAFAAAYPLGSPIEPALRSLVDSGASCKAVGPGRIACRIVESEDALTARAWHVALETNSEKTIQHVRATSANLGP
jgi:hypothetical protein